MKLIWILKGHVNSCFLAVLYYTYNAALYPRTTQFLSAITIRPQDGIFSSIKKFNQCPCIIAPIAVTCDLEKDFIKNHSVGLKKKKKKRQYNCNLSLYHSLSLSLASNFRKIKFAGVRNIRFTAIDLNKPYQTRDCNLCFFFFCFLFQSC